MTETKKNSRYLSLDVLRGMTIALMIVVNTPGNWNAIYAPFKHAAWHGFTLTDLVYPTFLFVVGNAMSFSLKKMVDTPFSAFLTKVSKRAAYIFLIGILLNLFPFFELGSDGISLKDISAVRIFGVLQRIGLCYFLAAMLIYFIQKTNHLIALSTALLLSYWGVLFYFGMNQDPYSLENNAVKQLDLWFFHAKNLYQGFGVPFEPEGVLSTVPSVVNVLAGYLVGKFIQLHGNQAKTLSRLLLLGVILLAIALLWDLVFPINKALWTGSYVLYSLGWDLLIIGALMGLIDLLHIKKWTYFFQAFGKNPLFIYILAWVLLQLLYFVPISGTPLPSLFKQVLSSLFADKTASLVFAICYMLLLWLLAFWLDRKKIYIKV